jgi:hypothetical protein
MEKFQASDNKFFICNILWTKKMMEDNVYTYDKVKRNFNKLNVNILKLHVLIFPFHKVCVCFIMNIILKLLTYSYLH